MHNLRGHSEAPSVKAMSDLNPSPERLQQIRQQLEVSSAFELIGATRVLDIYTSFGVVQVPLPAGEFLVSLQAPGGCRRFGVVRFVGLDDQEGWA